MEVQQTQLVLIPLDSSRKLNQTAKLTNLLKNLYSHSTLADPAYTKLDNDCHKVLDTLKTAQLHCLSMDLVLPEAIKEIFDCIIEGPSRTG
jgi:hypothetical protein